MNGTNGLIAALVDGEGAPILYWRAENGQITAHDILDGIPDGPIMALMPATKAVLHWSDIGDLAPKQAEAAQRLRVAASVIGGAEFAHIATDNDGERVITAHLAATDMVAALDQMARDGVDPDIILPSALALPEPEEAFVAGVVGGEVVLRSRNTALPDEPALRAALVGDAIVTVADEATIEAVLLAQLEAPMLNLRQGRFAKKRKDAWGSQKQWRLAAWLLGTGLVASLMIGLITWFKYDRAIADADAKALAAAQKALPSIASVESAESALNAELARRGVAVQRFTETAAALYASVQSVPGVTLRDMRQGRDGLLVATVAAAQIDPVNKALIDLQARGYKITATPRQDASGLAMAEISVRSQ